MFLRTEAPRGAVHVESSIIHGMLDWFIRRRQNAESTSYSRAVGSSFGW
jgi:hypothetical protein